MEDWDYEKYFRRLVEMRRRELATEQWNVAAFSTAPLCSEATCSTVLINFLLFSSDIFNLYNSSLKVT